VGPWPERCDAGACIARALPGPATPGARCASRKGRAHRFANGTARTVSRGLRPSQVISVHASRREVTRVARIVEVRTLAWANPHVARKSAEVSKRSRGPRSAIRRQRTRARGPGPGGPQGSSRVKRRREAHEAAVTPRRERKARAGRSKGRRGARVLAGWKTSWPVLPARSVTRSRRRRARPPRKMRRSREREARRSRWRRRRQRLGCTHHVRSSKAGRLSVKQRLPGASTPGDERDAVSRT